MPPVSFRHESELEKAGGHENGTRYANHTIVRIIRQDVVAYYQPCRDGNDDAQHLYPAGLDRPKRSTEFSKWVHVIQVITGMARLLSDECKVLGYDDKVGYDDKGSVTGLRLRLAAGATPTKNPSRCGGGGGYSDSHL